MGRSLRVHGARGVRAGLRHDLTHQRALPPTTQTAGIGLLAGMFQISGRSFLTQLLIRFDLCVRRGDSRPASLTHNLGFAVCAKIVQLDCLLNLVQDSSDVCAADAETTAD